MKTVFANGADATAAPATFAPPSEIACPVRCPWLRRVGKIGFWFFLLKGCLWVASLGIAFYLN